MFEPGNHIYAVESSGSWSRIWYPKDGPQREPYRVDLFQDINSKTSEILFSTLRHGINDSWRLELATANLDGENYRRLSNTRGSEVAATWSPDGERIAFWSDRLGAASFDDELDHGYYHLFTMDADGSDVQLLNPVVVVGRFDGYLYPPAWSPDGTRIAFRMGSTLYTIGNDGSELSRLGETQCREAAWSPDSQWIAFCQFEDLGMEEAVHRIYVSRPDGTERMLVRKFVEEHQSREGRSRLETRFRQDDYQTIEYGSALNNLSWSRDGSTLRFSVGLVPIENVYYALYRIGVDGSDFQKLAPLERGAVVRWSPDDRRIVVSRVDIMEDPLFYTYEDGLLLTMSSDGMGKTTLIGHGEVVGYLP